MVRLCGLCFGMVVFLLMPMQLQVAHGDEFGRTGSLIFIVKANKPRYEIGEPIHITITLSNHTTKSLIINKRLNPLLDVEWEIFAEGLGRHIGMKAVPPAPVTPADFIPIDVNEEFGKQFDDLATLVTEPLKEGRYGIRLTYRNQEKQKEGDTWVGEAVTNLIWIEVKSTKKI